MKAQQWGHRGDWPRCLLRTRAVRVHGKVGQEEFVQSGGGGHGTCEGQLKRPLSPQADLAWVKRPHLDVIS